MVKQFVGGWAEDAWFEVGDTNEGFNLAKVVTPEMDVEFYRYDGEKFIFDETVETEWKSNGWK